MYLAKHPENLNNFYLSRPRYRSATLPRGEGICPTNGNLKEGADMGIYSDILLTVDYDRTLTAPDSSIPKRNLEAIEYFIAEGGTFTVNTGRSIPMSRCFLDKVPVNAPLLLYNGSGWYDPQNRELVRSYPIGLDASALLRDLQSRYPKLTVEVQGVRHHYIFGKNRIWEDYCTHNGASWAYGDLDAVEQPFLKAAIYGTFEDENVSSMYKAVPWEMEMMEDAIGYLQTKYADQVALFRACPRILDIHAKGCSKLQTARDLQQAFGKKILVCVGDAENDLDMLRGADLAFCPADGIVADRFPNVCPCAQGAVADVIYEKIPAILEKSPPSWKIDLDKARFLC